jgi:hypothetical protein
MYRFRSVLSAPAAAAVLLLLLVGGGSCGRVDGVGHSTSSSTSGLCVKTTVFSDSADCTGASDEVYRNFDDSCSTYC